LKESTGLHKKLTDDDVWKEKEVVMTRSRKRKVGLRERLFVGFDRE
jgi:hypothetical protein